MHNGFLWNDSSMNWADSNMMYLSSISHGLNEKDTKCHTSSILYLEILVVDIGVFYIGISNNFQAFVRKKGWKTGFNVVTNNAVSGWSVCDANKLSKDFSKRMCN